MTYVEKFRKVLKDIEVLNREQEAYKEEIMEILSREDAAIAKAVEEETV